MHARPDDRRADDYRAARSPNSNCRRPERGSGCGLRELPVDRLRAAAALVDRPDDQRLAAACVARGEDAVDRRRVAARLRVAALVALDAELLEERRSGPRKPIASSTRSAGCVSSVPSTSRERRHAGVLRPSGSAARARSPVNDVVEIAKSRSPPSLSAYGMRSFIGQRGHGVTSSGREVGGSPTSSIWVTDAGPSRWAFATQSAPVSPPPITITCLPAAVIARR